MSKEKLRDALKKGDLAAAETILTKRRWFGPPPPTLADVQLQGEHPLIYWVEEADFSKAQWALKHGADPNVRYHSEKTRRHGMVANEASPLSLALMLLEFASKPQVIESIVAMIEDLLKAGATLRLGRLDALRAALAMKVDAPARGFGTRESHAHKIALREKLVRVMLAHGADASHVDEGRRGSTLHWLTFQDVESPEHEKSSCELMDLLVSAGADPLLRNSDGRTFLFASWSGTGVALHVAARHRDILDVQDNWGLTALHHGARGGNHRAVEQLLSAGANPLVHSRTNETPLDLALKQRVSAQLDRKSGFLISGPSDDDYARCIQALEAAVSGVQS